ncbi:DUF397 domain-containing protein [Streptomyces odontomachi]|uniref:DUF397 domain-containing protein n=1 Tax=Streptomyces odontomachi TaxID=2944940 RepID=UPI0027E34428|nr:DUF397 domain-containing protein [Streptomyces sp. ODS25]
MISFQHKAPSTLIWSKSSYSNGAGGECVECARSANTRYIRDSKMTDSVVRTSCGAWNSFLRALVRGDL